MNMNRPFRADYSPADPLKDWRRFATAKAVAGVTGRTIHDAAAQLYGDEAGSVLKAAVAPADTATPAWAGNLAGTRVGAFLRSLRPRSAAAQLLDRAPRFNLSGVASVTLPRLTADFPAPAWIAEGGAIPVVRGTFAAQTLGPVKKLASLSALTNELASYSAEDAEQIISELMEDAAAKALDSSIFSTVAVSAVQPAGILNGVTPITATAGGGTAAMVSDIGNLFGAIGDAGGGQDVLIFANARQAVTLQLQAGPGFDGSRVIATNVLAAGIIVAVDAAAFASGFGAGPRIDVSENAAIHLDDSAPLPIGTAGSPNTVAAPVRSAFQSDTHVLKLVIQAAWTTRLSGAVQYVTGATW
jgi:hypothetical protein